MTIKTLSLFDLAPGKELLGRYTITKTNRHGGMSTTFEAQDAQSGETCEVQVFPAALFENRTQALEFGGAMRTWLSVKSKHVLAAREVHALDDGTILFVTDLPTENSLRAWQGEHKVTDAATVAEIGKQLLDGLIAIHGAGLVHGDIKPHTIHVETRTSHGEERKQPHVELVDGGITSGLWSAKHLGDKTALIGTPFYAPVEQFGGESPNVQSDIYNLATVLFELATGTIPWKGQSFIEVFQAKLDKHAPSMKARAPKVSVPAELEAAIAGGLMADRKERYASAEEFKRQLAAVKKH